MKQVDTKELVALIELLRERQAELKQSWDTFIEAHEVLTGAIENYNETLEDVAEFRDDAVGKMTDYAEARSEKWQESDIGRAYRVWIGEWESLDLEPLDLPEEPREPDTGHADSLYDTPTEPE